MTGSLSQRSTRERASCSASRDLEPPGLGARVARAYHQARQKAGGAPFNFGPPAPTATIQRIKALEPDDKLGRPIPSFPTFGGPVPEQFPTYSNADFRLVPLILNGKTYAAGLGYGGVGWREIGDVLFSVYQLDGQALQPRAGFSVTPTIKRLASARATAPKVDRSGA